MLLRTMGLFSNARDIWTASFPASKTHLVYSIGIPSEVYSYLLVVVYLAIYLF